jgi:BlaI family penicillinase repressor
MKTTLTAPEWSVMSALWGSDPQSLSGVIAAMGDGIGWSYTTYSSYLNKLVQKGFVGFDTWGRDKFYYPLVGEDECIGAEGKSVIEKISEESAKKLLVSMIREIKLSPDDKKELRQLIDELSDKGD